MIKLTGEGRQGAGVYDTPRLIVCSQVSERMATDNEPDSNDVKIEEKTECDKVRGNTLLMEVAGLDPATLSQSARVEAWADWRLNWGWPGPDSGDWSQLIVCSQDDKPEVLKLVNNRALNKRKADKWRRPDNQRSISQFLTTHGKSL